MSDVRPDGHDVQVASPADAEYEPAQQRLQEDSVRPCPYEPAGHGYGVTHALSESAPMSEVRPDGHDVQDASPADAEYDPCQQRLQEDAVRPRRPYEPAGQGYGVTHAPKESAPNAELRPDGHGVQDAAPADAEYDPG